MTESTGMRVFLTQKQKFELANLVQAEYAEKGLHDPEFALYASEKLGCVVKTSHVFQARGVFGITSTLKTKAAERSAEPVDLTQVLNELHALQQMIVALDKRITTYFQ